MRGTRASVGKIIVEPVGETGSLGWVAGFSEIRNASEERTDMDVVFESERHGFCNNVMLVGWIKI